MTNSYQIVLCSAPDQGVAETLAGALVEERLAACVNILPGITSIYRWEGETRRDSELLLFIKSREKDFNQIEQRIVALHPYELPEVIAVPIQAGLAGYLSWIEETTGSDL